MNKRWIIPLLIVAMVTASLSCTLSIDLGPAFATKTPIPPTGTATLIPPTATQTEAPTSTIPAPKPTAAILPTEKPAIPEPTEPSEPVIEPTTAPAPQAQVISVENSPSLTLKRTESIGIGSLQKLVVSPDGKTILLSYSTALILLNMSDLSVVWKADPGRFITDVTFSKDGEHLISISAGGAVQLYDVATGNSLATIFAQKEGVRSVSLSGHGEYFAVMDFKGETIIYDTGTGKPVQDNNGANNPGGINSIQLSQGGEFLLIDGIGSRPDNKQIQQWKITDGKFKIGLLGVIPEMVNWKFAPGAKRIFGVNTRSLTSSPSNTLNAWNADNGTLVKIYKPIGLITDYKISPDGATILVATEDNQIHLLDMETGNSKGDFTGHTGRIAGMDFTPDSQGVVSISVDGKLIIWDVVNQKSVKELALPFVSPRESMMFSMDGSRFVLLSPDKKKLGIVDTGAFSLIGKIGPEEYALRALSISPQGNLVAAMDEKNRLNIWDVASGKKLQMIETKTRKPISKLKFAPNEALISSLSEGQIIIWDIKSGKRLKEMTGQNDFDFSPVEKIIVSDSTDYKLYFSDVDSGKLLNTTVSDYISTIKFSPDGKYIAVGGRKVQPKELGLNNLIYQVDVHTKERLPVEMPEILGTVNSTVYSPDMHLLAASDNQGNVFIWSLLDGKKVALFDEIAASPSTLAFNKDGTQLFVGGGDGSIGVISTTEAAGNTGVQTEAASPDGKVPELSAQPYTHSKGSVTINLPMGWKLEEPSALMFTSTDPGNRGSIAFMATNTLKQLTDEAFMNYINGCEGYFATSASDLKEINRNIDPANNVGVVNKTIVLNGNEYGFNTIYVRDGAIVYQLNFLTLVSYIDIYTPLYQGVSSSLKVNKDFILKQSPYDDISALKDPTGKFSYSIPTGWYQITSPETAGTTIQFNAPDNSADVKLAVSDFKSGQQATDTQAFVTMQTLLENQEGVATIVTRTKTDSGDWKITYALQGKNRNGIIIGTRIDSTLQMLNVQFAADFETQYRPLAERIAASLKKN